MKKNLKIVLVVIVILFVFRNMFDPNSYRFSALEVDRNITRQQYLFPSLGKIYSNRLGLIYFNNIYPKFFKLEYSFFSSLSSVLVYIPFYAGVVYLGLKKFNEK